MCSPWQSLDARRLRRGVCDAPEVRILGTIRLDVKAPFPRGAHLALNTDDMKMTLDFYLRVLGMPLVHALRVPPGLGTGPGNAATRRSRISATTFSTRAAIRCSPSSRSEGAKPQGDRDAIGTMQHVSFAVSEQKFNDVLNRIKTVEYRISRPGQRRCETYSIYVLDPNGIRLEFSHQKESEPRVVGAGARPRARRCRAAHPDRRPGVAGNRGCAPARAPPGWEIHHFTEATWTSETTSNATTPA